MGDVRRFESFLGKTPIRRQASVGLGGKEEKARNNGRQSNSTIGKPIARRHQVTLGRGGQVVYQ